MAQRMAEAARRLTGSHDYRNFCKMDVINVSNFRRTVHRFDVKLHARCPQCAPAAARRRPAATLTAVCAQGPVAGRALL